MTSDREKRHWGPFRSGLRSADCLLILRATTSVLHGLHERIMVYVSAAMSYVCAHQDSFSRIIERMSGNTFQASGADATTAPTGTDNASRHRLASLRQSDPPQSQQTPAVTARQTSVPSYGGTPPDDSSTVQNIERGVKTFVVDAVATLGTKGLFLINEVHEAIGPNSQQNS